MRIATFATYRAVTARHGGQIRLRALHETLIRDGLAICHVAVHTGHEDDLASNEISIALDAATQADLRRNQMRADVHACTVFDRHPDRYHVVESGLDAFEPDVFWLEQPWLWPLVKAYVARSRRPHSVIVYGSQNVEAELVATAELDWDPAARAKLATDVKALEDDLCRAADGIVSVCPTDAKTFYRYKKPALLAPNGVSPPAAPGGLDYWKAVYRHTAAALFVGSAHPPNAQGFETMLGWDMSYLAPDEKIVVLGGVCDLLQERPAFRKNRSLILPRVDLLHQQDPGGLATLLGLSKAVLLPIVSGGGTNLKTAEALFSRKPIVATTCAFRGYEAFIDFPNVRISDDPHEFRALLKQQLRAPDDEAVWTDAQTEALDRLLWSRSTAEVARWIRTLAVKARTVPQLAASVRTPAVPGPRSPKAVTVEGVLLKPMLHEGWHTFEVQGTWSRSRIATLRIPNPYAGASVNVTIEVEVMSRRGLSNTLSIYSATDQHFSRRCSFKGRRQTVTFTIRHAELTQRDVFEVYIEVQKLFQPQTRTGVADERALGCRIVRMTLTPVPAPTPRRVTRSKRSFDRIRALNFGR